MSVLEQATPASSKEVNPRKSSILITGSSGSGKTTAACTPSGRKLLIDIDNRSDSISGFQDVEILPCYDNDPNSPRAFDRLERIKKELWSLARQSKKKEESFPYSVVIIDGISSLYEVGMNWALLLNPKRGLGGAPAEHHWMPQMHVCKNLIKSLLALPTLVICTGHEDIENEGIDEGLVYLPKCTGKHRTDMPRWFNETYYAWRSPSKKAPKFYLSTQGTNRREYLKSSMNQLGTIWDDPVPIELSIKQLLEGGDNVQGIEMLIQKWETKHNKRGGGNEKPQA